MARIAMAVVLLLLATACGGASDPGSPPAPRVATPPPEPVFSPRDEARQRAIDAAARRTAELRRLRRSRTVEGALRRALLTGRLTRPRHDRMRRELTAARRAVRRLPGARRVELAAVLRTTEALAARRELTADRLDPVLLILERNTRFWSRAPMPRPGQRTSFGADPVVFQYYAGQGLQIQPLASWGRANGLAAQCLRSLRMASPDRPCRRRGLTRMLDRLVGLGARRGGFLAWEHYFAYGGGRAPWISGMTQATAIQALARAHRGLGTPRHERAAERALGAFEAAPPTGIAVRAPAGRHYLMYSFSPTLRILNGNLQAVIGLRDLAVLGKSRRADRLFRRGERAARRAVRGYDTGAWSLYSSAGRESTLGYHQLVGGFLRGLCDRTRRGAYCGAGRRFARYEVEPPRIRVRRSRRLRARREATVAFSLSKVSRVRVRLVGRRGVALRRDLDLPRGAHRFAWTPPARGRYRLRVEADGPSGPRGVAMRTLRVTLPKPKPRRGKKGREREAKRTSAG